MCIVTSTDIGMLEHLDTLEPRSTQSSLLSVEKERRITFILSAYLSKPKFIVNRMEKMLSSKRMILQKISWS